MADEHEDSKSLMVRMAVLETRVNLISLALKGVVGVLAAAAVKYFFFSH